MIASKNHGGRKAAGPEDPNNAIDDVKVVPNERFKDHSNTGELVIKIAESRPAPPTRRSSPHTSPFCARLGDATGAKIEATPDGRGEMTKELRKGSAQHDDTHRQSYTQGTSDLLVLRTYWSHTSPPPVHVAGLLATGLK